MYHSREDNRSGTQPYGKERADVMKQEGITVRMEFEGKGRERGGRESSEILESWLRGKIKRFIKQTSIPYYPAPMST